VAKEKTVREEIRDLRTELRAEIGTIKRQLDRIELAVSRTRAARVLGPVRPTEVAGA
jgi:hypothetical protein